ncbi:hypothetical protein J8273_0150 [Carpediemonas membranifera]|uniref:B box-type domain-containing protein n=1 Tax=Carpediemonas membranifera TaxID=201153 RepID=A0A8J6E4U2_9EUKA|nr:hypothetical protein J8273_0150 [Carpediemonas membranifera]|eukprot:KAG9394942.1 hypothetical protein J8273_0150 [Carpediemonas membranifera]
MEGLLAQALTKDDALSWQISAFLRYSLSEEERHYCRVKAVHRIVDTKEPDDADSSMNNVTNPLFFIPEDIDSFREVLTNGFQPTPQGYHFGRAFVPEAHGIKTAASTRQVFRQLLCDVDLGKCIVKPDGTPIPASVAGLEPGFDSVFTPNSDAADLYSEHYWTVSTVPVRPLFIIEYFFDMRPPSILPSSATCRQHQLQFNGICMDCNVAVCPRCLHQYHEDHHVMSLAEVVEQMTEESATLADLQDRVGRELDSMAAERDVFITATDTEALKLKDRLVRYVAGCTDRLSTHDSHRFMLERITEEAGRIEAYIADSVSTDQTVKDRTVTAIRAALSWNALSFARRAVSGAGAGAEGGADGALSILDSPDACAECDDLRAQLKAKDARIAELEAQLAEEHGLVESILSKAPELLKHLGVSDTELGL